MNIRLPADLIERLERAAEQNQRAFKAEIVARLERTFAQHMNLSEEGLDQILKNAVATTELLWQMFAFVRDVDLDSFLADQALAGNVMTREQAIAMMVRAYLADRGYVFDPPARRPGLPLDEPRGPFANVAALMGDQLGPIIAQPDDAVPIAQALEAAARQAIERKLSKLESDGVLRRKKVSEGAEPKRPGRKSSP